ncbi:MAG: hypothetical protein U9N30_00925 [Campylobacterota bacterium]|nr:hypothetical protein [Campylobacterota bacterium]
MRSTVKKIAALFLLIGISSSLSASDFRHFGSSNHYSSYDYYKPSYKPYYKKRLHHKKQKRLNSIRYYDTNNPNITIMVKDSRHVSKREIKQALKQYLSQNFYGRNYWR